HDRVDGVELVRAVERDDADLALGFVANHGCLHVGHRTRPQVVSHWVQRSRIWGSRGAIQAASCLNDTFSFSGQAGVWRSRASVISARASGLAGPEGNSIAKFACGLAWATKLQNSHAVLALGSPFGTIRLAK